MKPRQKQMQNESLIDFILSLYDNGIVIDSIQMMRVMLTKFFLNEISFETVCEFSNSISNDANPMNQLLQILNEGINNEPLKPSSTEKRFPKKKNEWTIQEQRRLRYAKAYLGDNWSLISQFIGSRDRAQCYQHYINILDPNLKHDAFSTEEIEFIYALYSKGFHSYSTIAKFFQDRSSSMVRIQMKKMSLIIESDLITINQYNENLKMEEMRNRKIQNEQHHKFELEKRSERFKCKETEHNLEEMHIPETDVIPKNDSLEKTDSEKENCFFNTFWEEMEHNKEISKYHRKYSDKTLKFCFCLQTHSNIAYSLMKKCGLPLPSRNTIQNHLKFDKQILKSGLTTNEEMFRVIDYARVLWKLDENESIDINLGIDAFSVDIFKRNEEKFNSIFLYQLIPLNSNYSCVPIRLLATKHGHSTEETKNLMKLIIEELKKKNINVKFISSDGDSGYDASHKKMLQSIFTANERGGFREVINYVSTCEGYPLSDFLHLVKISRKRLLNCPLSFSTGGDFSNIFSASLMEKYLHLGKPLTDFSQIGKMKDLYPLKLFQIRNALILNEANEIPSATYIVIFSMWNEVMNSASISRETRIELLEIIFEMLLIIYNTLPIKSKTTTCKKTNLTMAQSFATVENLTRCITTVCGMASALSNSKFINLAMNRLSTHPVENFIGMSRESCHSQHTYDNVINSVTNMTFANQCKEDIKITNCRNKRINVGGVRVDDNKDSIEIRCEIKPDLFAHVMMRTLNIIDDILKGEDYERLNEYIWSYLKRIEQTSISKMKLYDPHDSSSHSIMTRNICNSFSKKEENASRAKTSKWTDGLDSLLMNLISNDMPYDRIALLLNSSQTEIQIRQDHIVAIKLQRMSIE